MSSKWELKEHSEGELLITVEGEQWEQAQTKAFQTIAKKLSLPGFRKGKVPTQLAKKHIQETSILMEAVELVASDALVNGLKEHDIKIVGKPALDIKSLETSKVELMFHISVYPEVTLGQYKNLEVVKDAVSVNDDEVNQKIEEVLGSKATFLVKEEGAVEDKDTAIIDFEGFKDGVAFEGGAGEDYSLEIGSNTFIPGFEEQIIGMKKGESKEIKVTFPQEYQAKELAGQEAVFKVTVKEIETKQLPTLNDEFVKELKIADVTTVEEYKANVLTSLEEQKSREIEQKFENDLIEKVIENTVIDLPNALVEKELDSMMQNFEQRLQSQGFNIDLYLQVTNSTIEDIREQMRNDAIKKAKLSLIMDEIVKVEDIQVSEDEINEEIKEIANTYKMEEEQVKSIIPNESISYDLSMRKAMQLIKETAGK